MIHKEYEKYNIFKNYSVAEKISREIKGNPQEFTPLDKFHYIELYYNIHIPNLKTKVKEYWHWKKKTIIEI